MKKHLVLLLFVVLIFGVAQVGNAVPTIITFNDLSGNVEVTNQYASDGITFFQTFELDSTSGVDGWEASFPAKAEGDNFAYSGGNAASLFVFTNPIDSFSLHIASNMQSPPGMEHDYYFEAYDNIGNFLSFVWAADVPENNWYLMSFPNLVDFYPVHQIKVHNAGNEFAFDNITFTLTRQRPGEVPEPSTLLLLCMGLIGFTGFKRKIRQ